MRKQLYFPKQAGFSLVELMVAMVFVSLLMAGMLQVFAASNAGFKAANESIGAQRSNRWALAQLEEDLSSIGYFFPIRPVPGYISVAGQAPFMINPAQVVKVDTPNATGLGTTEETLNPAPDDIQFLTDVPLAITAELAKAPADVSTIELRVLSGSLADVRKGDFVLILDPIYEVVQVDKVAGNVITLNTDPTVGQDPLSGTATGIGAGLKTLQHQDGASVVFVRPLQVVRYSIQGVAVDPASADITLPCLVREQMPYPSDGAVIDWSAANPVRTVVAENVSGLRLNISVDGGTTWERQAADGDWAAVAARVNTRLATLYPASQPRSVTDPSNPLWYRYVSATLRVDITTRSSRRIDNSSVTGTASYGWRERQQTLFVNPRNFGLGL